jgi:predicted transcriptional regulator of viral defense system
VKNNTNTFLSPKETEAIARLSYEKAKVVTLGQMSAWLKYPPGIFGRTIARLKKKGILRNIKKGIYFYSPIENGPAGISINEYLIPPVLFPKNNYYVGYSNMFNYYGFLDQIPQTMYILNTTLQRQKAIGKVVFKLLKVPPTRIYGVVRLSIRGGDVMVSDRERTLVDLIYFPKPIGGMKAAFEILKNQVKKRKMDVGKLIRYAVLFPGKSTRKRIGYILEQSGVSTVKLKPLMRSIEKSSLTTLYGSKSRKGPINKTWKVILDAA